MAKKKVALSYGHGADTYEKGGGKGVKVNGKVYEEHTHNVEVGKRVKKILEAHGIDVLELQPPMGKDVPLKVRTDRANSWGADLYWSIHANASSPSASGWCAFYWGGSAGGKKIADLYAQEVKAIGLPLYSGGTYASKRGHWTNFHELRETDMVACLTENGFMTNSEDFKYIFLNKDNYYEKMALAHAKAILAYFGMKYNSGKTEVKPNPAYTVDPEDRLGEVELLMEMNYRKEPDLKAPILRVLPEGHKCHYYEIKGHWMRLGTGWVSNAGGKYVRITKKYDKKPAQKEDIHRIIVDGEQIGAFANDKNVVDAVEKAIEKGAKKIDIEEV